jgi:hypothetical protein
VIAAVLFLLVALPALSYRIGRRRGGEWVAAQIRSQEAAAARQLEEDASTLNVIEGVVLPDPEDPRWDLVVGPLPEYLTQAGKQLVYHLGDLRVWLHEGRVRIMADRGPKAWSYLEFPESHNAINGARRMRYFKAIDKAWIGRQAFKVLDSKPEIS